MTPDEFIKAIAPSAQASAAKTGIPASFTVAEAALESGWGGSQLAAQACNLFGVKADPAWKGPVLAMQTREYLGGKWTMVPANWRKYPNWQGCMDDHAQFLLTNRRYRPCFSCSTGEAFARAVATAGYATDPQYADKIIAVIRAHNLGRLDVKGGAA